VVRMTELTLEMTREEVVTFTFWTLVVKFQRALRDAVPDGKAEFW